MKRSFVLYCFLAIIALALQPIANASTLERNAQLNNLKQQLGFEDKFIEPEVGTVPLPESKEMAYPYPNGVAKLIIDYPNEVQVNEEFNISVTYQTYNDPYCSLFLFHQMYIPSGANLPTTWRQINFSPWDPGWNKDITGAIESLPSVDWVDENWGDWFGVGIAPMESGNLLMHSTQDTFHGHYFWALNGDIVTMTSGPFSFDNEGEYQFEILPIGWYWEEDWNLTADLEPVSFDVEVGGSPSVEATIDIKPDSLNLSSKGKVITAYIELPDNLDPSTIDVSSIKLDGFLSPLAKPTSIGDYDNDGIADLMVKFKRSDAIEILKNKSESSLTIEGQVGSQTFSGQDTFKII